MTDTTLKALMTLVERAVRPVCASGPRKKRMREELLDHVTAVFHEELGEGQDEQHALEAVKHRFGQSEPLTRQLQESVSSFDARVGRFEAWLSARPGESIRSAALRHGFIICSLPIAPLLLISLSAHESWSDVIGLAVFGVIFASFVSVFVMLLYAMQEWFLKSVRSYKQICLLLAGTSLATLVPFILVLMGNVSSLPPNVLFRAECSTVIQMVFLPFFLLTIAFWTRRKLQRVRDWERLDLAE